MVFPSTTLNSSMSSFGPGLSTNFPAASVCQAGVVPDQTSPLWSLVAPEGPLSLSMFAHRDQRTGPVSIPNVFAWHCYKSLTFVMFIVHHKTWDTLLEVCHSEAGALWPVNVLWTLSCSCSHLRHLKLSMNKVTAPPGHTRAQAEKPN